MTEIVHHAIIASTFADGEEVDELVAWCEKQGLPVLKAPKAGNSTQTVFVPPHGRKSYGADDEDTKRETLKLHLETLEG